MSRTRYSGYFDALLRAAEDRATWPEDRVREYRDRRLRAFILDAVSRIPFYERWFAEAGVDPRSIRTLEDLSRLPVLRKRDVQDHIDEILPREAERGGTQWIHTSGTTGGGLRFLATDDAIREQWATWWRYRHWHGLTEGTWCGYFGGRSVVPLSQRRPPYWRFNVPGRQILFSGYHLGPENVERYIDVLERRQPPWLHGYPSLLALVATHLLERGRTLAYRPGWVTIGAENLLPHQAAVIERAFGTRPRQHYGMAEAVSNMSECEAGSLHIDEDFAATELVRDAAGTCRIVGTNFSNPATPLIRYEVGDTAVPAEQPCSCGRWGRVVESIDGRQEDYVVLASGARVGRMDHVFKDMVRIREAQIRQTRPGAMTIRIAAAPSFGPDDEAQLLGETRQRVGEDMEIAIEYVDRVPRSRTGKLRFVVSEIPAGRITEAPLPEIAAR